jgi:hypothetical protein
LISNQQVAGSIPAGGFNCFRYLRGAARRSAAVCYHFATILLVIEPIDGGFVAAR